MPSESAWICLICSVSHASAAALSLALAGNALAGCGSDAAATPIKATPTKAAFIAKADAACHRYDSRIAALPPPPGNPRHPTKTRLRAAVPYLTKVHKLEHSESKALHALGTPSQDAATFSHALADFDASTAHSRDAVTAARAGNIAGFETAFAATQTAYKRAGVPARQFGLKTCFS